MTREEMFPFELYQDEEYKYPIYRGVDYYWGSSKVLKENQEYYGYDSSCGAWNLIITHTKDGRYIAKHHYKHLNGKEYFIKRGTQRGTE